MAFLFLVSAGLLLYVFSGYVASIRLLVWIRGPRRVRKADITPRVTLIISAFNEAAVIRKKVENALALEYPPSQLEIVVVSDASDDGTDDIVREYAARGVRLQRQPERRGKTAGLNATVPLVTGEIVVFSDANAIYRADALRNLARNFADPDVGCVTGEARYVAGAGMADKGERVYWGYEMYVKRLETELGSMVGGDGAIYAIRKHLWRALPENAINDFLNPLQIVAAGWRGVYEPEAVCFEETAGSTDIEYRRRVRIVSRSWRAIFLVPQVLNPFHVGLFAWSVLSHKILRWLSGLFALLALVGLTGLVVQSGFGTWTLPVAVALVLMMALTPTGRRAAAVTGYFAVIVLASLVGLAKGSAGRVSGIWSTPRAETTLSVPTAGAVVPVGRVFLALGALTFVIAGVWVWRADESGPELLFWCAAVLLLYVYAGYPAALAVLKRTSRRPLTRRPAEPTICMLIAAHNEDAVIERKVLNALSLDYPQERLAIVVASDGSTDATNEIVRRFAPRVTLLDFPLRRGKIAVINEGMRSVTSEIVVLSDANTFLQKGALRALARNFADKTVGAVSGDVVLVGRRAALAFSEDMYYTYERWIQRAESAVGSMIGVDGALYAIRRELFVPPANDTILDDMAIPMAIVRAGRRVIFEPEATAMEQGSSSAREEFARKARVVAGAVQFLIRRDSAVSLNNTLQVPFSLISHKGLRWLSPAFTACAFVASLMLVDQSPLYVAAAGAGITMLLLGLAGCLPFLRRLPLISLAHYFCLVQAAAGLGFIRGVAGLQSVKWRRFQRPPMEAAGA